MKREGTERKEGNRENGRSKEIGGGTKCHRDREGANKGRKVFPMPDQNADIVRTDLDSRFTRCSRNVLRKRHNRQCQISE